MPSLDRRAQERGAATARIFRSCCSSHAEIEMGLMCLRLYFISILLFFPALTPTNAHLALARTLVAHHGNGPITNKNPPCETVGTSHDLTERAFFTLKATPSAGVTTSSPSQCKQTYGVMPCTHSIVGNIFLLAAYGYIMYRAAKLLSEGSELLLVVLSTGIIGGLLLPVLGVLPDTILVLVSGLGGSKAEAQDQVLVGIGLLAGSNVMLLTLLWGICLFLGRCDLERRPEHGEITAKDKTLTRKFDVIGTGVETDNVTRVSARIMCVSVIPFIVAQLSRLPHFSDTRNISVLTACVLSISGLVAYGMYQLLQPKIQEHRKLRAQKLYCKIILLQYFSHYLLQERIGAEDIKIVDSEGKVNREVVERLFHTLDENKDDKVMKDEVRVALTIYRLNGELPADALDSFMKDFDTDRSGGISSDEFLAGMERWCKDIKLKPPHSLEERKQKVEAIFEQLLQIEQEEREDEGEVALPSKEKIIKKAVIFLLGGTFMAALFADPLVDAISEFSSASHIPAFFVSFVLLPLASNSSEAVSSILFSSRKRKVNMSLTYSQIYGGVTMNNTMSLGIFLAVVYGRHLVWEFSSEVLIICLVTLIMGLTASIHRIFPLWMAGVALLLYPLSLALVAVLDYIAGWK